MANKSSKKAIFRKGQYQILEQVILFGVGLIILTSVFAIFRLLGDRIGILSVHDNFREVGFLVSSNLIEAYGQGKYFYNATLTLPAPRIIGNRLYEISLNGHGVHVNYTDSDVYRSIVGLYNINGTGSTLKGAELSSLSPLEIFYTNSTKEAVVRR